MPTLINKLKVIGPWIMAAAIFAYLFHVYPPQEVFKAITYVKLVPFIAFCIGYFFFIYIVDSIVTRYVIARFTRRLPLKDILIARGVTYLIMVVSYPASQAAFAYYFKRRYKIPIFEILSSFLFIMFIDLWWIVTLAFIGSFFQEHVVVGIDLKHTVFISVIVIYCAYALWLMFWRRWPSTAFWKTVTPQFVERQRRRYVFHLFENARLADYARVAAMRIPIHFTIIVSLYVVVKTFGCDIPFTQILGNVPLVFLVGTLPITPGGLGTTNAVMVELLKGHLTGPLFAVSSVTPAELLLCASLLWMFGNYVLKIITGSILMGLTSKKLFEPTPDEPEESVEHEAGHFGGNL